MCAKRVFLSHVDLQKVKNFTLQNSGSPRLGRQKQAISELQANLSFRIPRATPKLKKNTASQHTITDFPRQGFCVALAVPVLRDLPVSTSLPSAQIKTTTGSQFPFKAKQRVSMSEVGCILRSLGWKSLAPGWIPAPSTVTYTLLLFQDL